MRKIIVSNMVSLDGYMAGPNGEIDWFVWDRELEKYTIEMMGTVDTILFGRVTYEMMASYWPTDTANNPYVKERMNNLPKIVFSKKLKKVDWNNSTLAADIDPERIMRMKRMAGKNIVVLGSGAIVSALAKLGLVDEYRIIVNPVLIGGGISMFRNLGDRQKLKLLDAWQLGSGVAILTYQALNQRNE
ncbi:MAG TPA: dihydrofolate reductase family protein [Methanomassiliicoccales archaeon]